MTVFMIVSGVLAVGMVSYNMVRNEMRLQRAEQQLEEAREKYHTENQG
jgi:type II secretory pathway pseudopilin PulG